MTAVRPYYQFREAVRESLRIVQVGRHSQEARQLTEGQAELDRLEDVATRLTEALGDLSGGRPADKAAVWRLLPELERELCVWVYEAPFLIAYPDRDYGDMFSPGLTLGDHSRPAAVVDRLNAARRELADLEPESVSLRLDAPAQAPELSALE